MNWGVAVTGAGLQTLYKQYVTLPGGAANPKANGNSYFFNFNNLAGGEVGIELMQVQMLPSISYKFDEHHTF